MNGSEGTFFLKKKDLILCIAILAGIILVSKIPVKLLFQSPELKPFSSYFGQIAKSIILVIICWQLAKHFSISVFFNTISSSRGKYWMLLLPLFFPGLFLYAGICIDFNENVFEWLLIYFSFFVTGLTEEIIFRGLLQGYLTKQYPQKTNNQLCIITSIFFALIHFNNIQFAPLSGVINQVIYAFFMGLLFSALMIRIGNTLLIGTIHGILNMISISCAIKNQDAGNIVAQGYELNGFFQVIGIVIVFSPTLLIYWFLLRGAPKRTGIEND